MQIENGRQPMGREVCVAYTALVSDLIPLRGDRTEQRVKTRGNTEAGAMMDPRKGRGLTNMMLQIQERSRVEGPGHAQEKLSTFRGHQRFLSLGSHSSRSRHRKRPGR